MDKRSEEVFQTEEEFRLGAKKTKEGVVGPDIFNDAAIHPPRHKLFVQGEEINGFDGPLSDFSPTMVTQDEISYQERIANEHWNYLKQVLEAHGETDGRIAIAECHYKTAWAHAWKHCLEYQEFEALKKEVNCGIVNTFHVNVGGKE